MTLTSLSHSKPSEPNHPPNAHYPTLLERTRTQKDAKGNDIHWMNAGFFSNACNEYYAMWMPKSKWSWRLQNCDKAKPSYKKELDASHSDCFKYGFEQCGLHEDQCLWMTKQPQKQSAFDRCSRFGCIPKNVNNVWFAKNGWYGCDDETGKKIPEKEIGVFWANCWRKKANGQPDYTYRHTSGKGMEGCKKACDPHKGVCVVDKSIVKIANFNGEVEDEENWRCTDNSKTLGLNDAGNWTCS